MHVGQSCMPGSFVFLTLQQKKTTFILVERGGDIIQRQLLEQISEGDADAFSTLFSRVVPLLQPSVFKILSSEEGMQEVIQETFIRIWLHRDKLPGLEKPLHWIFRIASNESYTWLRNQAIRRKYTEGYAERLAEQPSFVADPDMSSFRETSRLVHQAVERLSPQRKLIYQMSRNEGLKPAEIAEKLNLSPSYVRNTLAVALQYIREYLVAAGKVLPLVYVFLKKI